MDRLGAQLIGQAREPKGRGRSYDGVAGRPASPDDDRLSGRRRGYATQAVLAPVLKNQGDGVAQAFQGGRLRLALAIRAGNLWAIRDVPTSVPFHYRGELVSHSSSLLPFKRGAFLEHWRALHQPCRTHVRHRRAELAAANQRLQD